MSWLYALVWSAVAVGLVVVDWRRWHRYAPKEARVEPAHARDSGGETESPDGFPSIMA